ncbi:MAG: 8-oxoguanine deaminase, partial [Gammaproteobacteria bacterium]|nr:8-oxoguanine deaminase [Gammaproteobacteria bacterium]
RHSGHDDPLAALVICGANRADCVMVDGQWRVEQGQIVGLDVQGLIARHATAAANLRQSAGL